MASRISLLTLPLATALALAGVACGSDDGADVRTLGTETSGSVAVTGSNTGSGAAAADKPCAPVGEDLDPETTLDVQLLEYGFAPSSLTAPAGVIRFDTSNRGEEAHELAFLPGGGDVPFTDGAPDEDALADMGAFELEGYGPGQDCAATYDLEPGTYTYFCILEAADGVTHYEKGMRGILTVTR